VWVPDAWRMCNVHFGLVVHVHALLFILTIVFCNTVGNMCLLSVEGFNRWLNFREDLFSLTGVTVEPIIFVLNIVCNDIVIFVSNLFPTKFEAPFNLDLLHAAIFWLSFNVWSWLVDSLMSIHLTKRVWSHQTLLLPFVCDIHHFLWLRLEQTDMPLESFTTDRKLWARSKLDFEVY